jgi:hypothetical protein
MNLSLLRIVLWIGLYLAAIEIGLEIRAHYRGFDTLLFGNFQRVDQSMALTPVDSTKSSVALRADKNESKSGGVEVRYWIASSSHAEDSYLSRDVIFPSVLEHLLRSTGVHATIINASHAGMEIDDNTSDLKSRGPQFKPDYAILYQMSSTITSLSKELLSRNSTRVPRTDKDASILKTVRKAVNWTVWLVEQTAIYAQLKGNFTSRLTAKRVLADSLGPLGDAEFERKVRGFIATARSIGATPILCTFATSHVRGDLPNFPDSVVTLVFKYNIYLSLVGWVETIERFNRILRRIAAEEEVMLIDLENEISGHHDYFRDFVHFTPLGHSSVAKVIHQTLVTHSLDVSRNNVVLNRER